MTDKTTPNDSPHIRPAATILAVVLLIVLSSFSGITAAQEAGETWEDDFEDGAVDGWINSETNTSPAISSDSIQGENSLRASSTDVPGSPGNPAFEWTEGPILDLTEEFEVTGTMRYDANIGSGQTQNVRFGLTGADQAQEGDNAFILFDYGSNETRIGTYIQDESGESIDTDFYDEWVNIKFRSEAGSETIQAKVWSAGSSEPANYQIERSGFEGQSGRFGVNPGYNDDADRNIWLDDVTIEGQSVPGDPNLSIETRSLIHHGETQPYTVERKVYSEELHKNVTRDVTDEADVESLTPTGLEVNEDNHTLTATSDEEFQDRVTLRGTHEGNITHTDVAVADITMDNIEILPTEYRFSATLDSGTFQLILISVFAGIIGTRWSTAFGGLGMMQLVLVAGWFGGWVSTGIALVGLFTAMFIGLNLAANIDYTVRR